MKGKISHDSTRRFELEDNTVVVSYTIRAPPHSGQTRIARVFDDIEDEVDPEQVIEMFEGNISVIVPKAPHATKLAAYFEQIVTSHGSSMLNPKILFHCIRPLDSAIFHVAARGTLAELLALLQTREALLNDCDEFGRSILNYALSKSNVQICRFLTKHNYADANAVEQVVSDYPHRTYRPLFGLYEKLSNLDSEESSCRIDCQRILLEAGADPTIHTDGSSPFLEIASSGTLAALRWMLDADPYIDLEQRDDQGRTALMLLILHASRGGMHVHQEEIYDMAMTLLDHGADINASDINGKGCVETACDVSLRFHHLEKETSKRLWRLLVLLIDRGYDIYRTDCKKLSVCESALKSDLARQWFAALQASKFDYRVSVVLAEDHARYHQRLAADTHYHPEMSQDGHGNPEGLESRGNVQEIAITNAKFTKCPDRACGWQVWRNITVSSATTNPDGGGDIIHRWYHMMRYGYGWNRRRYSYLWENNMVVHSLIQEKDYIYFSDADYSLQELVFQHDLNDKVKTRSQECNDQEHINTIDEDASEAYSNHSGSPLYTVDSEDSSGPMANQQSRSHSPSALTLACYPVDDEREASEDIITDLKDDASTDEILQEQLPPLEPKHIYNADPQLSFDPWT
ncbi:hypothetical protein MMC27_002242 [Xylographa pallens]|nr:hypothetical protein [Xylographa pallens]